jgi:hemolysin activation/secretion protein
MNGRRLLRVGLLCGALFGSASTAYAQNQDKPVEAPRFEIRRIVLDGNTLLPAAAVDRLLAPYVGANKDFSDIQRALEALENAYREVGYGVVQISLPEQNITQGEIRFSILEPRLGKVAVEGNKHFDEANIRGSVPALREGTPPNSRAIARSLQIANENPTKQTTVLLRSSSVPGEIDAAIKVTDDKPWKGGVTLDNTGNSSTGTWRLGASYQHANVFNRDHVLTAQFITSPGHWGDVRIYGLGYRIPLYGLGSSIDVVGGYSDVSSGTLQNLFNVSGSGTIFGLRYNQHLPRVGDYEHKLVYGFDYRAYQNRIVQIGTPGSIVPDITVHPISAYYAGQMRFTGSELSFYVYAAQNVFPNGNDASDADFKATRATAKASYRLYRYNVNYARLLPGDMQFKVAVHGQETRDSLVPGEQFGLGGAENVRGFFEREVSDDRGHRASFELYSPDVGTLLGWTNVRLRMLGFFDIGTLTRRNPLPGEAVGESVSSVGLGMRLAGSHQTSMRIDMAQVLQPGGGQRRGDWKVHAVFSVAF